jgi:hypothetical protein
MTIEPDDSKACGTQAIVPQKPSSPVLSNQKRRGPVALSSFPSEIASDGKGPANPRIVGRTPSDLFVECVHDARVISVLLTFAPFPFFASSIGHVRDMIVPLLIAALLNTIWFGVSCCRRIR